jgi:hypothetical protein
MMHRLRFIPFTLLLLATATAAHPKSKALNGRATFYGGWALVADTCPIGPMAGQIQARSHTVARSRDHNGSTTGTELRAGSRSR